MTDYLNTIQIVTGLLAAAIVFAGLFLNGKKLNPEKYEVIPVKTTVISTILTIVGLMVFAVTITYTNYTVATEEHYELGTLYIASLGEVIKSYGFIVFVPLLFRLFKPKSHRSENEEEITEELSEESADN